MLCALSVPIEAMSFVPWMTLSDCSFPVCQESSLWTCRFQIFGGLIAIEGRILCKDRGPKDSFDKANYIGAALAVVRIHAEPDSAALTHWEGRIYRQGSLATRTSHDIE
ncbi:uncharacterized protein HMPREF1120_07771 [Exophiala dermatitidis NIH/UT8656]|uniref:Uncharacterized protein n=1 Tax=Exophiala dermatitidis (strain ATCC 34100 / CBS 525.76 / NIH/UT8656) TaxID=858893 RepID=H6C577_EXODN|nr:uncharacterized protein HMPREF1120_07771 [Exophiala dermatitidis NIH/UT8656]EHY59789.1 hypothetical protein HMPREF1120_07771 [Exophiala dermatitidis NIH/UT8656]